MQNRKQPPQQQNCPRNLKKLTILAHLKYDTDVIDEIFVIILFFRSNVIKYKPQPRTAREYRPTVRPIHLGSSLCMRKEASFLECLVTSILLPFNLSVINSA